MPALPVRNGSCERLETSLQRRRAGGRGRSEEEGVTCSWCLQDSHSAGGGRAPARPRAGCAAQPGPLQSPRHAAACLCHCRADPAPLKWMGAGSGPYDLTYREDLALNISRVLVQELLLTLPPWAFPSPPAPRLTPRSSSQMASRRLANVPVIKKPLFSKPFHSLFF